MSAQDFTRSASSALTESIANSSSAEEIRELCKSALVKDGVIVRERGSGYDDVLTKEAENAVPANPSSAPAAAASSTTGAVSYRDVAFRVIYPGGNDRYELAGASEEELDLKEAKIRAMYAGK
jgi:hypothetical protein